MDFDIKSNPLENINNLIQNKPETATKYVVYRSTLNPDLSVYKVYSSDEYILYTRLYSHIIYKIALVVA